MSASTVATPLPNSFTPKPVTDTGIRGFLKWFKQVQPGLYKSVAPQIVKQVPAAFSNYHNGGWAVAGLSREDTVDKLNAMYAGPSFSARSPQGFGDLYASYADFGGDLSNTFDPSSIAPPPELDVAQAANTGVGQSTIAQNIGAVINGASKLILTGTQAATQAQIVNTQLQRAAAGLPPLTTSLNQYGVPMVTGVRGALTGSTMLLLLALGGGVLLAMSGKK